MKNPTPNQRFFIATIFGLFIILSFNTASFSQGCLPPDVYSRPHFPVNITVYYSFDNIPAGAERSQIEAAIAAWNAFNSSSNVINCNGVTFSPGTGTGPTLIFKNGIIPNRGAARFDETAVYNNEIFNATITINPDLRIGGILFYDPNQPGYNTVFLKQTLHEIGHGMGLNHYSFNYPNSCTQQIHRSSAMNDACQVNDYMDNQPTTAQSCDLAQVSTIYFCPTPSLSPTPTPTPTPTPPPPGGCNGPINPGQYPSGCAPGLVATGGVCTNSPTFINRCDLFGGYDAGSCGCFGMCDPNIGGCSPVVVDVLGNGFQMTSAANGVLFDLEGNGTPRQFSWIAADSDDSWLALDRNNNGTIDSGRELFGNVTSQPPPPKGEEMNGFLALAQYDTAAFGGNGDGKINQLDAIFSRLKLWQDANHNGISESCELKTLPEVGLRKIDLDYRTSRRTDEFGNQFRYKAKVRDAQDAQLGRWAWDVYLVLQH